MVSKFKIDSDSPQPASAIAIATDVPIYRLCWLINEVIGWNLTEGEMLQTQKNNIAQTFFVFDWTDDMSGTKYSIIQNKSENGPFESSKKQFDYWLRIEGNADAELIAQALKMIKQIRFVQIADPSTIKDDPLFRQNKRH